MSEKHSKKRVSKSETRIATRQSELKAKKEEKIKIEEKYDTN
jgi:ribosome biogenesis protein ERB1